MTEVLDQTKTDEFVGLALENSSATLTTVLAAIGDRLGLFKDLAANGPATHEALAARTGLAARYVKEWLAGMSAAGYIAYDPDSRLFAVPREHEPVLVQEAGPVFFGGLWEMLTGFLAVIDPVTEAFRTGGGVPQSAFPEQVYDGTDRFTAGWHENLLLQQWIPAVPDVLAALERGIEVADVGCGRGRAVVKLAQAFPNSKFTGFDIFGPNIERAHRRAEEAGVTDRVRLVEADVSSGLAGRYGLVTTFDVIHDAIDPRGILRAIRASLTPDGTYLCLDINCSEHIEENAGPLGAFFYGASIMYCMTTSLANGGEGLGTAGLHPRKLAELATEAGFSVCRTLPLENPFNNLYELKL